MTARTRRQLIEAIVADDGDVSDAIAALKVLSELGRDRTNDSEHEPLQRATEALVQDGHTGTEWQQALLPLGASTALECDELGLYVEHLVDHDGTVTVRLHVPALGDSYESPEEQDEAIRRAVAAAARALGLIGGAA